MPEMVCRFGEFELDPGAYQLRRKGRPVALERIPLDLLFFLAERHGVLVTRHEIIQRIWGKGVFLSTDAAINTAVRKIRRALHDHPESPRFIETVAAKGYRFVAPMRKLGAVSHRSSHTHGPRTSLVGREVELAELSAGLADAASGNGRAILISGEAGIGKSRLVKELSVLAQANGMAVLVGHCADQEQAVPFLPFVEMLESIVEHAASADVLRTAFGELGGELTRLLPRLKALVPEFSPRTDLGAAESRRYLFNCFCGFVARFARDRPALMILEDLHWADDSTLALLDHLQQRLAGLPMLVVGSYRDTGLDLAGSLTNYLEKLVRERIVVLVRLKGLLRSEVAQMLESLSGQGPPPKVAEAIFDASSGNPFLIEELFRYMEEENRLYDSTGKFRPAPAISEDDTPPRIRLVTSRRLDRLSGEARNMLEIAAVIGRRFGFDILRAVPDTDSDASLDGVEQAIRAGLISTVEDICDLRFEFSHELIRQAVISGMTLSRRRALELAVAGAIERFHERAIDDHLSRLAHHYRRGGDREKAIEYLYRAGEQAVGRGMYVEAESFFVAALDEINAMPDSPARDFLDLRVRSAFAQTMAISKGYRAVEVRDMASRAHELAKKTGNLTELVQQLWLEAGFAETRGDLRTASRLIEDLLATAEREGSPTSLAMGHAMQLENRFFRGDFPGAEATYERGRVFFDAPGFRTIRYGVVAAFGTASWNACIMGYADLARERIRRAFEQTPDDPYDQAVLLHMAAVFYVFMRDYRAAESAAAKALAYSEERGFAELAVWHRFPLGIARAELGRTAEGIDLLQRTMALMTETGQRITMTHVLTRLAKSLACDDAVSKALETIDRALKANAEERYLLPETHRVRGELRLQEGDPTGAEADFRKAIAVAQNIKAKLWELRATISLARLMRKTRRRDEARAMLADVYNWFTGSLDTVDLKEAKGLLDEWTT